MAITPFVTPSLLQFDDAGESGGPFLLDLRSRELHTRQRSVTMQSQPFEVLRLLLERAGEVVARDEIRRRLWPADTFVDYERGLNAAIRRLRVVLGDDAVQPRFVETIPRVGYRFVIRPGGNAAAAADRVRLDARSRLAVLPVADAGGAAVFADGLTEELIVQVGRSLRRSTAVVARSSSMLFKQSLQRASEIGAALRVDYVLEGAVRMQSGRARATASLVETAGETYVWNETAESDATEPLAAQTDLAQQLTRSLVRVFDAVPRLLPARSSIRRAMPGGAATEPLQPAG